MEENTQEKTLQEQIDEAVAKTNAEWEAKFQAKVNEIAKSTRERYAKEAEREKMTAEETAAAEAKAAQEKLQNDYNALLKENTISKNVAKYIALGYDEKLAKSTAEALFDGDMETVFANAAKANQMLADKLKADLMRNSPRPSGAGTSTEEESEYMAFAKRSGKAKAQANEAAAKVMDYYK